jgi:putative tricarboxylic transport membrane protein
VVSRRALPLGFDQNDRRRTVAADPSLSAADSGSAPASADSAATGRPVVASRTIDAVVAVLLLALAALLGFDSWRTGIGWEADGPQAGYFPFYLAVMLAAASLFGLVRALGGGAGDGAFVTRDQLGRVMKVLVPTFAFVVLTQFLGLYVASFVLVASFMRLIGGIGIAKSMIVSFLFAAAMFVTFEIAFDVIMPKGPLEAALGY